VNVGWPDIMIGAIALIAVLKGYKRGFVTELSGAIALIASLVAPWFYNGAFDPFIQRYIHLGPGSAHVIGMFLTGIATYGIVLLLARLLNGIAKLPGIGLGNALGGAGVGLCKAAVGLFLVLYVALFFPLSPDIRADLHRSVLVHELTLPDDRIDNGIIATLPWFARPFARHYFERHRV